MKNESIETQAVRLKNALAANVLLCVLEVIGLASCFVRDGSLHLDYYTQLSNVFSFVASAILAVFLVKKIKAPKLRIPRWVVGLKFASVLCLTVTLLVVLLVLIPTFAGEMGFANSAWYFLMGMGTTYTHTLCPLLAIISFLYFERHELGAWKPALLAAVPTFLYGFVSTVLNVTKVWSGPYPFLRVYEQPIWATILYGVGILGGSVVLARVIEAINQRIITGKKN